MKRIDQYYPEAFFTVKEAISEAVQHNKPGDVVHIHMHGNREIKELKHGSKLIRNVQCAGEAHVTIKVLRKNKFFQKCTIKSYEIVVPCAVEPWAIDIPPEELQRVALEEFLESYDDPIDVLVRKMVANEIQKIAREERIRAENMKRYKAELDERPINYRGEDNEGLEDRIGE